MNKFSTFFNFFKNPSQIEKEKFESQFSSEVIEVAVVTGHLSSGAYKAKDESFWSESINLIAWKNLSSDGKIYKQDLVLKWITKDEDFNKSRVILSNNKILKLQVRKSDKGMMLVKVLDLDFKDNELEDILIDSLKPVYYEDNKFGTFELEKHSNQFSKKVDWDGEKVNLSFENSIDEESMKSALNVAHELFSLQSNWKDKIEDFAAEELIDLANDWARDRKYDEAKNNIDDFDEEKYWAEQDEDTESIITKEVFISKLELRFVGVFSNGDFYVEFYDGDLFWGHHITVEGNINGNLKSADI